MHSLVLHKHLQQAQCRSKLSISIRLWHARLALHHAAAMFKASPTCSPAFVVRNEHPLPFRHFQLSFLQLISRIVAGLISPSSL